MTPSVTREQWNAVRESLRTTCERFAALVSSVPDARARVTAKWSVADIAVHVMTIAWVDTTLLQAAVAPFPMPDVLEQVAATAVDEVHGLNDRVMAHFPDRDASRAIALLREHIGLILADSENRDPAETFSWLGGSRLSLAGMLAHMVNELLIHGNDIAKSVGLPWTMAPQDAALFFDLFYVGLARGNFGNLLDGNRRPLRRRIAVELRSPYTTPVTFVVRDGRLTAEPPGPPADATVRFDPATLNMMLFGRVSKVRAIASRKLVIGGPRPWLLLAFLRTVRAPARRGLTT
jgi:uncharacterized protein (TIGR03083 family)